MIILLTYYIFEKYYFHIQLISFSQFDDEFGLANPFNLASGIISPLSDTNIFPSSPAAVSPTYGRMFIYCPYPESPPTNPGPYSPKNPGPSSPPS